ncbi:NAD(P)/FAD-dependent oxidoreductase [Cytophagales bacterium LB-30]|uniref:NAD(P)/FAD-dependent oxidoreductase n=1 Tax=Shiella aurantiaca TaxID=3058365 RepID=A0ABT8F0Z3_9BACT|nr:NAD(P)/FAD-dependent oxidoreductase [Shiella aurantiaca]MDN4164102.1 NAD(P)/FAD-dependent oxidoreductase [Shiella aurantiaca]
MVYDCVVIGGGAAGFFSALALKERKPHARILILEKSNKLLAKVRVSGGGRCNVTHACFEAQVLSKNYPRGEKNLKNLFKTFQTSDTVAWFEKRGVKLHTEADGRVFPVTNSSETIIQCFLQEAQRTKIEIRTSAEVKSFSLTEGVYTVSLAQEQVQTKNLVIATGGYPKLESYQWIAESADVSLESPVPSLFTCNIPQSPLEDLAGISVPKAQVKITGTKLAYSGPLLITHWGLSGPAILKLSAWGARILADKNYEYTLHINWCAQNTEDSLTGDLLTYKSAHAKRLVSSHPLYELPQRLWKRLVMLAEIPEDLRWLDMSKKQMNKLKENILRFECQVKGKSTFKEEFVTCGGISWDNLQLQTLEAKSSPGLFFAGEVLDADGITGGFNFQNAWTTAYVAAQAISERI